MKINGKTTIYGEKVILIPYKRNHVARYHQWMQSPRLQELTASEPLTLEEEYEMQQSWYRDNDKCTFIILDRGMFEETKSEVKSMIGDTNLYFNRAEERMAEGEIMIAEPEFLKRRRGWEAMLLMFRYGVETLGVMKYQVKIGMENAASLAMFKKMKFSLICESVVFKEVTLEVNVNDMWKTWLVENTKWYEVLPHENEDLQ